MSTDLTAEEVYESLTGFDEIAIEKHFGSPIKSLAATNDVTAGRALVFTLQRRDGVPDVDAKHAAMSLTIKEVSAYFPDDDDDSGKDETAPEEQPAS